MDIRPLRADDDRSQFTCGDDALDLYFRRYAGQNQFRHHIGVTYVVVDGERIVAFLTVAAATLDADELPTGRRIPPYPVPVLRIARLGVATDYQGHGLGETLIRYAIELAESMRDEFGCVGLLVDSKPHALPFYERYGFVRIAGSEGELPILPLPVPMFLALGSVPRRGPPA